MDSETQPIRALGVIGVAGVAINSLELVIDSVQRFKQELGVPCGHPAPELFVLVGIRAGAGGEEGRTPRSRDTTARGSLIAAPAAGDPVIPRLRA